MDDYNGLSKKRRKYRFSSPRIYRWSDSQIDDAVNYLKDKFFLDDLELRDNLTWKDVFVKYIFSKYFVDTKDFITFKVLLDANRPLRRHEIYNITGYKKTTQYDAIKKLIDRCVVERIKVKTKLGHGISFAITRDFLRDITESFNRFTKKYECVQCNGAKEKIICDDYVERIVCLNPFCEEDSQYIEKHVDDLCRHGIKWSLCDDCRIGFLFKRKDI